MKWLLMLIAVNSFSLSFAQTPVNTTQIMIIGGIQQYISIKGKDNSKPLLLFLHGGPGGSVMDVADKFTMLLQEEFVVIQWDQRETGKTLKLNQSKAPLTLANFQRDTHDLIDSLLKQFNREKLFLAGHSWGTVLGFYIADHYPESLYAYVAISPVINQQESEKVSLALMKEKYLRENNKQASEELSSVNIPFENADQLYYHRKWLFAFEGQKLSARAFPKKFVLSWAATWFNVWTEATKLNLNEKLPVVKCPVYFFVGKNDYQTNFSISEHYFSTLSAPLKQICWFEKSGHLIPDTEPLLMQNLIIEKVLPKLIVHKIISTY